MTGRPIEAAQVLRACPQPTPAVPLAPHGASPLQPDPPASFSRVPTTSRQCVTSTTIPCTPHIYWPYKHITIAVRILSPAHHTGAPSGDNGLRDMPDISSDACFTLLLWDYCASHCPLSNP
jgi:hypothetical protein